MLVMRQRLQIAEGVFFKQFKHRHFFKRMDAHHQVEAHGDPYLGFDRIGGGSIIMLDAQMPLDPAKEKLNPPTQAVKSGNPRAQSTEQRPWR